MMVNKWNIENIRKRKSGTKLVKHINSTLPTFKVSGSNDEVVYYLNSTHVGKSNIPNKHKI